MITELSTGKHFARITDAVDFGAYPIISVVGAGGKTTVVNHLASEYGNAAVTTTTHIYKPQFRDGSDRRLEYIYFSDGIMYFGSDLGAKLGSSPLTEMICGRPLIIEADGARHRLFKIPAAHEPAIHPRTTAVIGILSLDALGRSLSDAAFRPEAAAEFLGTDTSHIITEADFMKVINSPLGLRKNVECDFYVFLTCTREPPVLNVIKGDNIFIFRK